MVCSGWRGRGWPMPGSASWPGWPARPLAPGLQRGVGFGQVLRAFGHAGFQQPQRSPRRSAIWLKRSAAGPARRCAPARCDGPAGLRRCSLPPSASCWIGRTTRRASTMPTPDPASTASTGISSAVASARRTGAYASARGCSVISRQPGTLSARRRDRPSWPSGVLEFDQPPTAADDGAHRWMVAKSVERPVPAKKSGCTEKAGRPSPSTTWRGLAAKRVSWMMSRNSRQFDPPPPAPAFWQPRRPGPRGWLTANVTGPNHGASARACGTQATGCGLHPPMRSGAMREIRTRSWPCGSIQCSSGLPPVLPSSASTARRTGCRRRRSPNGVNPAATGWCAAGPVSG